MCSIQVEAVWQIHSRLGEGPVWWQNKLYWIDILQCRFHEYDPFNNQRNTIDLPRPVGSITPRAEGGFLLAMEDGFHLFDPVQNHLERLPAVAAGEMAGRFNDGKCDPQGRFWAGTMAEQEGRGIGHLYRLNSDKTADVILDQIGCSNGLAWSADSTRFFYIDSTPNRLLSFHYDPESGDISDPNTVLQLPKQEGKPILDGMTIDVEGFLWIALWDGAAVIRVHPVSGEIVRKISVPARKVTSCTFGGADGSDLYITSACEGESRENLRQYPLSGSLFRCQPGISGHPATAFAG